MTTYSLLLLPGDGIGPEVMAEVERVVSFFNKRGKVEFKTSTGLVGGAAIDKFGVPLDAETLAKAQNADAIVFGAVGGPKWDKMPYDKRPEAGLLRLRKDPYFDWSQALLQIAIVLASVHLIIGNMTLLGLSGGLAALGVLLMLNGFTLALKLPLLG